MGLPVSISGGPGGPGHRSAVLTAFSGRSIRRLAGAPPEPLDPLGIEAHADRLVGREEDEARLRPARLPDVLDRGVVHVGPRPRLPRPLRQRVVRSEERRVGKEFRAAWAPDRWK